MGLYIKGMEMPENCSECVISRLGKCGVSGKEIVLWQTNRKGDRPPNCPLIHVPPHGRLIDEEALAQDAYRRMLECAKYERPDEKPYEVLRAIEFAPTVIPAEEDTNAEFELKWAVGAVKCQKCGYEWVAVRPVEAAELECPKCGAFEGRTKIYEQEYTNGE